MNTRGRPRILVDLKPAFDGFAGIPQETRLLYAGLRQQADLDVTGLIQHGAQHLRGGRTTGGNAAPVADDIFQMSRLIVSLETRQRGGFWGHAERRAAAFGDAFELRMKSLVGLRVQPVDLDARLFQDFVWRSLFEKTLGADSRGLLTDQDYRVVRQSRQSFHQAGLAGTWLGLQASYPRLESSGYDYFIAQTPYPGRLAPGTRLVVRYHDAVPVLMPHTIKDKAFHQASHYHALQSNIRSGAKFSCISEATRRDLLTMFPQAEPHSFVIPNMVSAEYHEDGSPRSLVGEFVRNRRAETGDLQPPKAAPAIDGDYLLVVSTLEPRKNHQLLLRAWERLRYTTRPDLKLVVVGSLGWGAGDLLRLLKPWIARGDLLWLHNVPSDELRVLYRHASATVCPSVAEGFDYSGVEAMRCGCPVAASDLPVHREVYEDAAAYFDAYDVEDAAAAISSLLGPESAARRELLLVRGRAVSRRYLPAAVLPQWLEFFTREADGGR